MPTTRTAGITALVAAFVILASAIDAVAPRMALAASFSVNSTADAVDVSIGDGVCESATPSECTLRAAIQEANALVGSHTISLPAGTYLMTIAGGWWEEDQAATGDLDITGSIALVGAGAESTVVDAQGLDRVVHIGSSAVASLVGITIRGGAKGVGAGIYNEGTLDITSGVVRNNAQSDVGYGGGIANGGTLTVSDSAVRDNSSWNFGTGIANEGGATATVVNSLVSGNIMTYGSVGGGIANFGQFTLTSSTVTGNDAGAGGIGGAIYNGDAPATMQISTSRIVANVAFFGGGAIAAKGTVTVSDSEVSANTAEYAAGMMIAGEPDAIASVIVVNTTVSGNISTHDGGGMAFSYADGTLNNVTITQNTADSDADGTGDGGGLYIYPPAAADTHVNMRNSIIAGNVDPGSQAPDCQGAIVSGGYNLVGNSTGCTFTGDLSGNLLDIAPNVGSLANHGGSSMTHALLPGSPAIDAGSPAAPGSGGNACETTDQRGITRPQGSRCDMGAYERRTSEPSVGGIALEPDASALRSAARTSRGTSMMPVLVALALIALASAAIHSLQRRR